MVQHLTNETHSLKTSASLNLELKINWYDPGSLTKIVYVAVYIFKGITIHHSYFFGILFFIFLTRVIDDSRFIFSYYQCMKSFRFLNLCRKISVPTLIINF